MKPIRTKKPAKGTRRKARSAPNGTRPTAEPKSLSELTRLLRDRLTMRVPSEYGRGKERLREEVMSLLSCSSARAEHLIDSMVAGGHARFGSHPRFADDPRFGIWHLDESP
jgi:hypothetical protein